jgi:two-component system KDP operon response regulator KdpE
MVIKSLCLVVEKNTTERNVISTLLKNNDYRCITAGSGEIALMEAFTHNPDMILVNIDLPDMHGMEFIQRIRKWSNIPIMVLSERIEDAEKIHALDMGADDYMTKPFSTGELLARFRVMQRHLALAQGENGLASVFENGDLKIDFAKGCAYIKDEEIHLTPIEYKLLCLFSKNVGKVLTHSYITQMVWGSSWDNNVASLRVFMAILRKKIEKQPETPRYIQTHVGVGYRMMKVG